MGRQPFGLASPAAWLRGAGVRVDCFDLSQVSLDETILAAADWILFYLPMHTATRIALAALPKVRRINPAAHLGFYGLYAPVNEALLREVGAELVVGGEFERAIFQAVVADELPDEATQLKRLELVVPDRAGLPELSRYAHLHDAEGRQRVVGYTEASRGCKHHCRHCPVVPVYQGRFFVVPADVVLEDIARQVDAGARHVTFGDPDFFNAPRHAEKIVNELHRRFPDVSYDVTVKVEHLKNHADLVERLAHTGCAFVTTAVESFDDRVLELLDKGHSREDFAGVLRRFRELELTLAPTFVAFGPWTTPESYLEFLEELLRFDLVDVTASIQLALRLLVPSGSLLIDRPEIADILGDLDAHALVHPWIHADPRVDALQQQVQRLVEQGTEQGASRREIFVEVLQVAGEVCGRPTRELDVQQRVTIPFLTEPWYC